MSSSNAADGTQDAAAAAGARESGNRPARNAWFRDLGFGLFVHWSVDVQLGTVISHSLVGSSRAYRERYFRELPATFCPDRFDPAAWARLARVCGARYVVFTAKHHNGFCMWHTATTEFSIANTPFGEDVTRALFQALRSEGLAVGVYFSPDDFLLLHEQGHPVSRKRPEADPRNNPQLMARNRAQLEELFTGYGPVDLLFLDGVPEGLADLARELAPEVVVTRGDLLTPEQHLPDAPAPGPWEACLTLGDQWQYRAPRETYKSAEELVRTLAHTRARGGNLLLNLGPRADGSLPEAQTGRLRELGLWLFVNGEAVYAAHPRSPVCEGDVCFTRSAQGHAVYAMVTRPDWAAPQAAPLAAWALALGASTYAKTLTRTLASLRATDRTEVAVLGHDGQVLAHAPEVDPAPRWSQGEDGLSFTVMSAQRLGNRWDWPHGPVVKLTGVDEVAPG